MFQYQLTDYNQCATLKQDVSNRRSIRELFVLYAQLFYKSETALKNTV